LDEATLHTPSESSDPRWTDTWFWNAIDPVSGAVVWLHISWLPAARVGQHVLSVVCDARTRRLQAATREPFRSTIATVEHPPEHPELRIRSEAFEADIRWDPFRESVDFGDLLEVNTTVSLRHLEGGGSAHGRIGGREFVGRGFRDRSLGPRDLRGFGRHWALGAMGLEQDVVVTANAMWRSDQPIDSEPSVLLGCRVDDQHATVYPSGLRMARRRDGTPARLELPDGLTIDVDLEQSYGQTHFVPDPNSTASDDISHGSFYALRDVYVPLRSAELGPLVGWYEEGVLWRG
jgi:hypothetical protein